MINFMVMSGNDYLDGGDDDDTLNGGSGNDHIYGGTGNDTLRGGYGDYDYMSGGYGDDTYLFVKGDGYADISSYDTGANRNDVLRLQGINQNDVRVNRISGQYSDDLQLTIKSTGEIINISGFFRGSSYEIQQVIFADGTWDTAELKRRANKNGIQDTLTGTDPLENFLYGGAGDNTLIGSDKGNDYLEGWYGDDTLNGGKGNDNLEGGVGNDTYLYARGDGSDFIHNYANGRAQQDTLRFTDINADEITLSRHSSKQGDNLHLSLDDGSFIGIVDFFKGKDYELQKVEFSDGTVWQLDKAQWGTE